MTRLGTAFVDVQPDFSAFDRRVAREFSTLGQRSGRDFADSFKRATAGITVPAVKVNADASKAHAALDRVEAHKKQIGATDAEVKVDVDRSAVGTFSQLAAAAQNLFASLGGSGGGGLGGATARVSAGFVSFGTAAGPLAALLASLAVTVGVSLVGAFAALASSVALATAAVGALGTAVASVLGPALALAVAAGTRMAKVFEALKAQDTAADEIGRKAAAGSQAAAAAAGQQAAAARGLTEANRQLGQATTAAYREMADAAEAASDAIRGVANARFSLDEAKHATAEAKNELAQFRAEAGAAGDAFASVFDKFSDVSVDTSGLRQALVDANRAAEGPELDTSQQLKLEGLILRVRGARLREKEATDGVSDAMRAATRAQQLDNQFKRQGIAASESYQGALRGVEAATLAVAAAQKQDDLSAAHVKAIDLTNDLSASELRLLDAIKQVRTELRGAFQPATDAVFGGMLKALNRIPQLINPLRGAFARLGEAWGDAIDAFSQDLVRPDSISKLRAFTDGAAKLAGPVTRGLSALLDIFTDIARAALPYLVSGTEKVADKLKEWAVATGNTRELNKQMKGLMGHLKTWLGVGGSIANVFLAFLPTAAGEGKSLAESIKGVADRTAAWLRTDAGKERMKQFFKDAVAFAKDLAKFVGQLVGFMTRFGQVGARVLSEVVAKLGGAKNAADTLVYVLGTLAALKFTRGIINGVKSLHAGLTGAHKAATLLHAKMFTTDGAAAGAGLVGKSKSAMSSIATGLASAGKAVVDAGRAIGRRLIALFGVQGAAAGRAAGAAAAGTSGLNSPGTKTKMAAAGTTAGKTIGKGIVGGILLAIPLLIWEFKEAINKIGRSFSNSKIGKIITAPGKLGENLGKALGDILGTNKPSVQRHFGGPVPGFGNTDSVRALLTPKEFVIQRKTVAAFGGFGVFADINEGRLDPRVGYAKGERATISTKPVRGHRFASGGPVGPSTLTPMQQTNNLNVTVPGGGPPDPVALGVAAMRIVEARAGGFPRQD